MRQNAGRHQSRLWTISTTGHSFFSCMLGSSSSECMHPDVPPWPQLEAAAAAKLQFWTGLFAFRETEKYFEKGHESKLELSPRKKQAGVTPNQCQKGLINFNGRTKEEKIQLYDFSADWKKTRLKSSSKKYVNHILCSSFEKSMPQMKFARESWQSSRDEIQDFVKDTELPKIPSSLPFHAVSDRIAKDERKRFAGAKLRRVNRRPPTIKSGFSKE